MAFKPAFAHNAQVEHNKFGLGTVLSVKVNKNWRNSPEALHLLGYEKESER